MNAVVVVALGVALFVGSASSQSCERHGAKCPDYTVVQKHQDYEERLYPSLVWVSASEDGISKANVSRKLIKKLYAYLGGENEAGEKFEMMVPVRTKKESKRGLNKYTMAVALLPSRSENPPRPNNPTVSVTREPTKTYFSRSFGSQVRQDAVWDDHAKRLLDAAAAESGVDPSFYYMCVYDSPWRESDRLNEVWMEKKEF